MRDFGTRADLGSAFDRLRARWYVFGAQAVVAGPGPEQAFLARVQRLVVEGVTIPVARATSSR